MSKKKKLIEEKQSTPLFETIFILKIQNRGVFTRSTIREI